MTYEPFEKMQTWITKRILFIIFSISDILTILIMLCAPEGNLTLCKFVIGILSLIGFNYVMLKFTDLILSL